MRWLSALTVTLVTAGAIGALAAPATAAAPVVDVSVQRTLNTPTDVFPVSPTRASDLDVQFANLGETTQAVRLTLSLPAGWGIEVWSESIVPGEGETCEAAGNDYVCTYPALPAGEGRSNQFLVTAAADTPVGSLTTMAVAVEAVGAVDADPSNNTTQFRLRNVGSSEVSAAITQSATSVPVNGVVEFTVTLTNAGPDATVGQDGAFHIVTTTPDGFTQQRPTGPGQIIEGGGESAPVAGPDWSFAYDLAPGATAVYRVRWQANRLGAVGALRFSTSHDPSSSPVDNGLVRIESDAVTVAAASSPTATASPTTTVTATDQAELAATGSSHVSTQVLGALLALLLGATLTVVARRRRGRHAL